MSYKKLLSCNKKKFNIYFIRQRFTECLLCTKKIKQDISSCMQSEEKKKGRKYKREGKGCEKYNDKV